MRACFADRAIGGVCRVALNFPGSASTSVGALDEESAVMNLVADDVEVIVTSHFQEFWRLQVTARDSCDVGPMPCGGRYHS